jgi:hypothetical protein
MVDPPGGQGILMVNLDLTQSIHDLVLESQILHKTDDLIF